MLVSVDEAATTSVDKQENVCVCIYKHVVSEYNLIFSPLVECDKGKSVACLKSQLAPMVDSSGASDYDNQLQVESEVDEFIDDTVNRHCQGYTRQMTTRTLSSHI